MFPPCCHLGHTEQRGCNRGAQLWRQRPYTFRTQQPPGRKLGWMQEPLSQNWRAALVQGLTWLFMVSLPVPLGSPCLCHLKQCHNKATPGGPCSRGCILHGLCLGSQCHQPHQGPLPAPDIAPRLWSGQAHAATQQCHSHRTSHHAWLSWEWTIRERVSQGTTHQGPAC